MVRDYKRIPHHMRNGRTPIRQKDPILRQLAELADTVTIRDLADRSGHHPGVIVKIRNGTTNPHFLVVVNLAGALGYHLELVKDKVDESKS